jgi:6-methylsalicylate decarboxylase
VRVPTPQITSGSDYPYFPFNQIETIRQAGPSDADLQAIESANAAWLLRRLASASPRRG